MWKYLFVGLTPHPRIVYGLSHTHCFKYRPIYRYIDRDTGISIEISVFSPKRYDKCKILSKIVFHRYGPIYRHGADISADIRDENI